MKRLIAILTTLLLLLCVLPGCSSSGKAATSSGSSAGSGNAASAQSSADASGSAAASGSSAVSEGSDSSTVNLMDMYTISDPEGVDYDQRIALYMPILESDEHYADGCRELFTVLYGKDGKGVYMYNVEIYETEEQATAYMESAGNGEVDGTAYITTSDAAFFAAMESFVPDFDTWINNMMASGMMELE